MPWENRRKRRYSDVLEDPYRGPPDFMEAGVRGFLVTTVPDREEHGIDEAVKSLRKACIKLYGGIRPLRREDASFAKGYVMVDFMDPESVIDIPHPDAEKFAAEEKEKEKNKMESAAAKEKEEDNADEVKNEEETEKIPEQKEGEKKVEESKKKKGEEEEKSKPPLMLATHKFNGCRTELRNIMFVKADVPDPTIVATTALDLLMDKKPLFTDCINQLLPVQGVCDNDYKQLEIMCRRVLVPYIGEHLEEAPSFGVMLVDKMCEPGAEVLLEVVRSAIWCLNPSAYQCSPWSEPDVVIHIEIIGSKIILSAMPHYMKYRQYSPFACHELGEGKPRDENDILQEMKDEEIQKEKEKEKERERGRKKKEAKNKNGKKSDEKEAKEEDGEGGKKAEAAEEKENTEEVAVSAEATEEEKVSEDKKPTAKTKRSGEKKAKS